MPKISLLAVGLLFIKYLQRSFCSASQVDPPIGATERNLNDYVCHDQYFTGATVKESVGLACANLHTLSRQKIFPALLEESELFGRDSGTLLTWPILYESIAFVHGVKGKTRVVINMECELVGVVLRHEDNIELCLELLHDDNKVSHEGNSLDSEEFVGYQCSQATFRDSHVLESFRRALTQRTTKYPRLYRAGLTAKKADDAPNIWPLFETHQAPLRRKNIENNGRCFLVFTRKQGVLKVIQLRRGLEKKCEQIRKTIVPFVSRPNIPESPKTLDRINEMGHNCNGQIFTGRYIEMNRKKAMTAIADYISGKHTVGIYRHEARRNGISPGSWKWPIRGWETNRKGPKKIRFYALIFGPEAQFLGVHILEKAGYTKCERIYDSKPASKDKKELGFDLNMPNFCQQEMGSGEDC